MLAPLSWACHWKQDSWLKSLLAYSYFQKWLLVGLGHSRQLDRNHVIYVPLAPSVAVYILRIKSKLGRIVKSSWHLQNDWLLSILPTITRTNISIEELSCTCSWLSCLWTTVLANLQNLNKYLVYNIQWNPICIVIIYIYNYVTTSWKIHNHPSFGPSEAIWWHTVYPKKYAHGFVVLCFVVVMQSIIMNSHDVFIHIHQGCFAGTGAIVRLPQCQWSRPDGYGKISQYITTTKHSKAKTVCIFLGIYCRSGSALSQVMACSLTALSHYLNQSWLIISNRL